MTLLINLRYSDLSFDEMMQNWESCFLGYQTEYEQLIYRFPNVTFELKKFSLFVTDKILIDKCTVFDFCLCRAMNQYLIHKGTNEFLALEAFRQTLLSTAIEELKCISIIDASGNKWFAEEKIPFKNWLDAKPQRYFELKHSKLLLDNNFEAKVA
ncbi:hypothetical protein D5R81_07665 [Parashewanella spongiae]|uniref:Uncharacterized protein n=1 Tax=Parashewanella spongiae TaxID=342950 RepID=A0A3A6U860_9GAMM|nr:hypothetical protein [Parashewanella spongiae]MCL1077111.1 hypothetical protein [Parashewanella spongiae]RJY17656.1 hypothetical protein D5R81_07665 [Parashewanella spongiae]